MKSVVIFAHPTWLGIHRFDGCQNSSQPICRNFLPGFMSKVRTLFALDNLHDVG
jgi:hypothetical protein